MTVNMEVKSNELDKSHKKVKLVKLRLSWVAKLDFEFDMMIFKKFQNTSVIEDKMLKFFRILNFKRQNNVETISSLPWLKLKKYWRLKRRHLHIPFSLLLKCSRLLTQFTQKLHSSWHIESSSAFTLDLKAAAEILTHLMRTWRSCHAKFWVTLVLASCCLTRSFKAE